MTRITKKNAAEATQKQLHLNAKQAIRTQVFQFADGVVLLSKILAQRDGADEVQAIHVKEARDAIYTIARKSDRAWQILFAISMMVIGYSFTKIFDELSLEHPKRDFLAIYILVGFAGVAIGVWAHLRK